MKSERVFKALDNDLVVIVLKVTIKERNEIFHFTLFVDLNVRASVKDVSFNLASLLHGFKADTVILVELSFHIRNDIAI